MGEFFDKPHTSWETELRGLPCKIADSAAVAAAKAGEKNYAGYIKLGKALSRQLRYREAAGAFSLALRERPEDLIALRLRAGQYLSTLQTEKAREDFENCLALGNEALDITYRLGLCAYYAGDYSHAMGQFEACLPLADDEMGVAILYWHTLCAYRSGRPASLLSAYHAGMEVGHHFAYEKAVRVCAGAGSLAEELTALGAEADDLHYTITAYALSWYLRQLGQETEGQALLRQVRSRDGFWPCYAYLAAWNDENRRKQYV